MIFHETGPLAQQALNRRLIFARFHGTRHVFHLGRDTLRMRFQILRRENQKWFQVPTLGDHLRRGI